MTVKTKIVDYKSIQNMTLKKDNIPGLNSKSLDWQLSISQRWKIVWDISWAYTLIAQNEEAITLEASARSSADWVLQSQITVTAENIVLEANARSSADWVLQWQITVNASNINLKVSKNDVINQINISTEWIRIQWDNITLDWNTSVLWTFSIVAANISDAWAVITADNLDEISDWTTYKRTTVDQVTWAWRAFSALNSSNRYIQWLRSADMIAWTNPSWAWLVFDSWGMRWYNSSGTKTFEISASDWSAFFSWSLWANTVTSTWYVYVPNATETEHVKLYVDVNPRVEFKDDWSVIWSIYWDQKVLTVWWTTFTVNLIKADCSFWIDWDLLIGDDIIVADDWLVWWVWTIHWSLEFTSSWLCKLPVWSNKYP